jgi:hypothetical protein
MNNKDFDFSYLYKSKYNTTAELKASKKYDLFLSAYNDSERVKAVFNDIEASDKHWMVFPQYQYTAAELPLNLLSNERLFTFDPTLNEGQIIRDYIKQSGVDFSKLGEVCIDITGFIRPHLVFLIRYLSILPIKNIDFLYSDPIKYIKKEQTDFSSQYTTVRQIDGCQGMHNPETNNDYLVIAAGYDNLRITDVSRTKANSKKIQLFGFPSLQPDMYQENILKAYISEEATSNGRESFIDPDSTIFAPANDPFVTANIVRQFVDKENKRKPLTNLYLCPLSTKAQTLGLALYFITNCVDTNVSIIFPICNQYSRETTEGISKIWKYTVEFQNLK